MSEQNISEFSLRILAGMQLIGEALFELSFLIWTETSSTATYLKSNLSENVDLSLIFDVLGCDSNFFIALSIGSSISFAGSNNDSLAEIPKLSVMFANKLLKISAISESLLIIFPSSIKVMDEFS